MNPKAPPLISVQNVYKSYENGLIEALKGISFDLYPQETLSLLGPSGCGKSTLLNLLGGLDNPTQGKIFFLQKEIALMKPLHLFRAQHVGFVFQFHHLVPSMTLLENVEAPLIPQNISKSERRERAQNILKSVGLSHRIHFLPSKVSGGERQRAALARALIHKPSLILADEPTGQLDSTHSQKIIELLFLKALEFKACLVIATHNPEISQKTSRTLFMQDGTLKLH